MSMRKRIEVLEEKSQQDKPYDCVVYCSRQETEEEALQRFEHEHGRPFSESGLIVQIDTIDASAKGGNRVLPRKGEPGYEPD